MNWHPRLLFCLLLLAICSQSLAAGECDGCEAVKKIENEFRAYQGTDERILDEMQIKGSAAIQAMPRGKGDRMTRAQVKRVVDLFKIAAPRDPAFAILDNNANVIQANLPAFMEEYRMLPVKEAQWLIESTNIVMGNNGVDQAGEEKAVKTPGKPNGKATASPTRSRVTR